MLKVNHLAGFGAKRAQSPSTRVLGLHFDGSNGATSTTDIHGHTCTFYGSAQISTTQSKFGGSSLKPAAGPSNYVGVAASSDFVLSGDFTIRFWLFTSDVTAEPLSMGGTNNWEFYFNGSGYPMLYSNGASLGTGSATINSGAWKHIEIGRSGTALKVFADGVSILSITTSATFGNNANELCIGDYFAHSGTNGVDGYIDDLEIFNGSCLNTANFTPPTAAFS